MKQIEVTKGLAIDSVLKEAKHEAVILTRRGRAVALVSELNDEELYWYAREKDPAFITSVKRARKQVQQGKTVRHDDLKRRLGLS